MPNWKNQSWVLVHFSTSGWVCIESCPPTNFSQLWCVVNWLSKAQGCGKLSWNYTQQGRHTFGMANKNIDFKMIIAICLSTDFSKFNARKEWRISSTRESGQVNLTMKLSFTLRIHIKNLILLKLICSRTSKIQQIFFFDTAIIPIGFGGDVGMRIKIFEH